MAMLKKHDFILVPSLRAKRSNPVINVGCSGLSRRYAPRNDRREQVVGRQILYI